ncbi:hypothetical protein [Halodesulfovibrio marinisediminis]|uniref:PD-(D/E)XK nuclease superfamily protein n=1 Tax=Halodesulfovibrio marinisediminis DSM 17456 TaxID=1121457 RepID=A0A1N6IFI0_9BACT|nr:hypothetical protein [Halodesulfovibrio marinisediminis]SIO30782.1 hypothetical protein SAMN02745161_2699 [Halodesulfovibrio marinisediminis DSM 17456]
MRSMNRKADTLLAQLAKGLLKHGAHETQIQLGDRSQYVGMSDVGKGVECMRAAVAGKLGLGQHATEQTVVDWYQQDKFDQIYNTLKKQLVLQRGHWLESGIANAFQANGANTFCQLEIATQHKGIPIKAHLDFALVWGWPQPTVRILELKSTERIPGSLYTAYETQLYGQLGFLVECWNLPVFSMWDEHGVLVFEKLTFSQAVKKVFGFPFPEKSSSVDIEGWVLCLAMSEAKAFGPYRPSGVMLKAVKNTAEKIWKGAQAVQEGKAFLKDISYCHGFHPLCDYCEHACSCPKFEGEVLVDTAYDDELMLVAVLKDEKRGLEKKISAKEERIKAFYNQSGVDSQWLKTAHYRFKNTRQEGRKTLDMTKLEFALINEVGEQKAQELLVAVTKYGQPFERLHIAKI